MTNYKNGMLIIAEIFFQPFYCFKVKIVSRLVEQQIVRVAKESLGQHYANFFFSAQVTHHHLMLVILNT